MEYAREYVSITTIAEILTNFKASFFAVTYGLKTIWIAGAIGLIAVFFTKAVKPYRWIIFLYAISSAATVIPGFYFRPHYFILFLPALGLLAGVTVVFVGEQLRRWVGVWLLPMPFLLFGVGVGYAIWLYDPYFFHHSPMHLCTSVYREENPFAISMDIADYIQQHTTEQDKIVVLGSEPQIYFYSKRLPASGFIYTYALAESQPFSEDMQREMIAEIEKVKPKFIVLVNSVYSWGKSINTVKILLDWYLEYVKQYETVEVIDINPGEPAKFYTGEALQTYQQKSKSSIWISELKTE
jgi:hypothetical protein